MPELCSSCQSNQDTVGMWMFHLASCHPLPSEWLSEKARLLKDDENDRPYTVVTDSRKRRRRPTTPRPLNTFMIFSRHIRRNILAVFPDASNSELSKELGIVWKEITRDVKSRYEEEAKRLALLHAQEFPDYKYQPKKRKRRSEQVMYERQVASPADRSRSCSSTDDENLKDNRPLSDVENQYIRYSALGKNIVRRECQAFSPLKQEVKEEAVEKPYIIQHVPPKPFSMRIMNGSNIFIKPQKLNNLYFSQIMPSESLVLSSSGGNAVVTQEVTEERSKDYFSINDHCPECPDPSFEEEIDITSNIFENDIDIEWGTLEDCKQDLPNLNSLFHH